MEWEATPVDAPWIPYTGIQTRRLGNRSVWATRSLMNIVSDPESRSARITIDFPWSLEHVARAVDSSICRLEVAARAATFEYIDDMDGAFFAPT